MRESEKEKLLNYEQANSLFRFDGERLYWRPRPRSVFRCNQAFLMWNKRYAGEPCGAVGDKGYLIITVTFDGKSFQYYGHRIIWLLTYREWPSQNIDHIDGNPLNNAVSNLRDVPQIENAHNMAASGRNTSGVPGVVWCKATSKWHARIKVNEKVDHLGSFPDFSDAVQARVAAEKKYNFHPNHGRMMDFQKLNAKEVATCQV